MDEKATSAEETKRTAAKFVSERIIDALWHYGIDSYKRPALNLGALLFEFTHLVLEHQKESIPAATIDPVFDELIHALKADFVFPHVRDRVVDNHIHFITSYHKQKFSKMKKNERYEIEKRIIYLFDNYFYYVADATKEIIKRFLSDGKEKRAVFNSIGDWLTENIHRGISHEGLYSLATSKLPRDACEGGANKLLQFISTVNEMITPENQKQFYVTLKVKTSSMSHLIALIKPLTPEVIELIKPTSENRNDFYKEEEDSKWLRFKVQAPEKYAAKQHALQQYENLMSLVVFENHNFKLSIGDKIEVQEKDGAKELVKDKVSALHRREDGAARSVEELAKAIIEIQKNRHRDDVLPLLNAFKAHNIAVQSCDIQNQILTIWSAFEALIPYPKTDGSRLEYFSNYLAPVIASNYPAHLITQTLKRIGKRHPRFLAHITAACPASSERESIFLFVDVLLDEKNPIHKVILSEMSKFPLDIFKYSELNRRFKTPKNTLEEITRHEIKVKWQLARIYRLRNSIAHQGKAFFTVPLITEHAHSYLDKIIRLLIEWMKSDSFIKSPFDAILAIRDDHLHHLEELKELELGSSETGKVSPNEYILSEFKRQRNDR